MVEVNVIRHYNGVRRRDMLEFNDVKSFLDFCYKTPNGFYACAVKNNKYTFVSTTDNTPRLTKEDTSRSDHFEMQIRPYGETLSVRKLTVDGICWVDGMADTDVVTNTFVREIVDKLYERASVKTVYAD